MNEHWAIVGEGHAHKLRVLIIMGKIEPVLFTLQGELFNQ